MSGYYSENLASERLRMAYDLATPRVVQYLNAEIAFVIDHVGSSDTVLELGCGYGRILDKLASKANQVIGIDSSLASLGTASKDLKTSPTISLAQMDAIQLGFKDKSFDRVVCIQNGISAFHVDPSELFRESIRIAKPGGTILFSSYSEKFWEDRLEWFRIQADHGLIGEIDWNETGNGIIVCEDGFRATTFGPENFEALASSLNLKYEIREVDDSSIFCVISN